MSSRVSRSALRKRKSDAIDVRVTLLGLDRTTGSIGFGLKSYSERPDSRIIFNVVGRDLDNDTMKTAHGMSLIDNYHRNLENALENADIVFLNEPLPEVEELFVRAANMLKPGVVIIDLSRLKQPTVDFAKRHFPKDANGKSPYYLVGATPLIGFENLYSTDFSVEASREFLFRSCDMLIAPDASVPAEAVKVVTDITDFLSMQPRFMDPAEHDALASIVDGIPTMLAMILFQTTFNSPGSTDLFRASNSEFALAVQSLRYASARDLAMLWRSNRDSLSRHINEVIKNLDAMRQILLDDKQEDPAILEDFLAALLKAFEAWEVKRQMNRWDEPGDDAFDNIQGNLSVLGNMFGGHQPKTPND